jgi:amidase
MADCAPAANLHTYATALARRDSLRRRWDEFLMRHPVVLMPTSCRLPMPWGEDLKGTERMQVLLRDQSPLIGTAALGLPGLNVPTGLANGVPVGVQLVGGAFQEQRLLAAGQVLEGASSMPDEVPPVKAAGAAGRGAAAPLEPATDLAT